MKMKKDARLRRAAKARRKIRELNVPRLCIHRTPKHIYAQLISQDGNSVVVSASTLEKELKQQVQSKNGIESAVIIGKTVAQKAVKAGVKRVAFDRSGYKFHGRVKALADAARESGLEF